MTTATRELPPHGSTARAYGSPRYRPACKCDPCRNARNRHQKQMRVNRELGRSPFTNPEPARARLAELHATMSWKTLVAVTGLELSALVMLYQGRRTKIRHETHAKIMAVVPPTRGDGGQYIDVTGTARRVQALSHLGHSYTGIARAAGTARNRIFSIANGHQPTVRRDLAARLAIAYQQLAFKPPAAGKHTTRARNVARMKGWHGPLAWDESTIDDPTALPDIADTYKPVAKNGRDSMRRAEIAHLLGCGESVAAIAQRMNANEKYINDLISQGLDAPTYEAAA